MRKVELVFVDSGDAARSCRLLVARLRSPHLTSPYTTSGRVESLSAHFVDSGKLQIFEKENGPEERETTFRMLKRCVRVLEFEHQLIHLDHHSLYVGP